MGISLRHLGYVRSGTGLKVFRPEAVYAEDEDFPFHVVFCSLTSCKFKPCERSNPSISSIAIHQIHHPLIALKTH